jgi:dTDP-glucose pyrophosphorylase/predicted transcriptional regulator
MISERCRKILIKSDKSLKFALKQIDQTELQVLIVIDNEEKILGLITDGDIRRAIIKGINLQTPVKNIMTKNPIIMTKKDNKNNALNLMKQHDIRHIPIVDDNNKIVEIYLWKDFLKNGEVIFSKKINPVIIMAGGKGTRLDPFTKILPKPLIPIDEKPVIEIIMDNFKKYGFNKFIISLNYKGEMIKMYFADNPNTYQVEYIQEKDFLGTIGALSLLKDKLKDAFIVSNCDVVIDENYDDLLNYHIQNNNQITILGINRNINIPYGVLKMKHQCADFDTIIEKPDYHFIINSGVYVLESEVVDLIPINQPTDIPQFLELAKKKGLKIQVYPDNCSWFDIGEWEEYKKAIEYIGKYKQ